MAKEKEIRVLLIEDVPADVLLVERELRHSGLACHTRQVDSEAAFLQVLQHDPPDVILSDHGLPSFDGFAALALARERCPGVPFIFVTGSLGEEKAIEAFENGAAGCVLKDRLAKLGTVVQRALDQAEERRPHEHLPGESSSPVTRSKDRARFLPICAECKKIRDGDGSWQALETYFRRHFDVEFSHGLCPGCAPVFFPEAVTKG
jgi:CheY-like chemotaxis protein